MIHTSICTSNCVEVLVPTVKEIPCQYSALILTHLFNEWQDHQEISWRLWLQGTETTALALPQLQGTTFTPVLLLCVLSLQLYPGKNSIFIFKT